MQSPKSLLFSDMLSSVFKIHVAMQSICTRFLADQEVSVSGFHVIWMLSCKKKVDGPMTAPELADSLGVSRQGIQKQIHILLKTGFVEAQENLMNKRSPKYSLTSKGAELHHHISAIFFSPWIEKCVEHHTETHLNSMAAYLGELSDMF